VTVYPDNVFERWAIGVPDDPDPDPRQGFSCIECGTTFAWRGYDGLYGWCQWFEDFGEEAE
jgi:hypothetical protein